MTGNEKYRTDFVLYLHRHGDSGDIFYVGIGAVRRAYEMRGRNYLWERYVNKHGKPRVEIYKTNLNYIEAQYLEQSFIKALGRRINKSGILTNLTIGGEGFSLMKKSESEIKTRTEWMKKNYVYPKGEKHWNFGRLVSDKQKKKTSEQFLGKKQSIAHVKKRIKSRGYIYRPEQIENLRQINLGKPLSAEHKKKVSITSKDRWQDEKFKNKMSEMRKGQIRNSRKFIHIETGTIYNSGKDAALALGFKQSYFCAMVAGHFTNHTGCVYLEPRPFKSGKGRKHLEATLN